VQNFLHIALAKRRQENALRKLFPESSLIDFCSNDYLGFSKNLDIQLAIEEEISKSKNKTLGATGSRLISGNTNYVELLEKKIANHHHAETALIFNSGYDANVGLLSCIARREDTIIYDSLSHASIIDGVKLSAASKKFKFIHNNLSDLEKKIRNSSGNIFVVIESLYSMDGDFAPLVEIEKICSKNNANLIVDEAHANGVYGKYGNGITSELELENKIFARIYTFGKAIGAHGAAVVGSNVLRDYLINFSRAFIYTTAMPFHSLVTINCCYNYLENAEDERYNLLNAIQIFQKVCNNLNISCNSNQSPIQSIIIPGNDRVKNTAFLLIENGFDVRPILSPTVAKGRERLRICLHSYNTKSEIETMLQLIKTYTIE
jgi:8-amino-7-oxononanoate synthase